MLAALLPEETFPLRHPRMVERSVATRLQAAYVLRGYQVNVSYATAVTYMLLPELSKMRVVTQFSTREWGQPKDLQELAWSIAHVFPLGVMVFHHGICAAFLFTCGDESPRLMNFYRALRYGRTYADCLCLARIETQHGVSYAKIQITRTRSQSVKQTRDAFREFLFRSIIRIPWQLIVTLPAQSEADTDESFEDALA